jgi:hypothetical protein
MTNNKQQTAAIIGAILTMVVFYFLISFVLLDVNAKNWNMGARVLYCVFSPLFSIWVFVGIKIGQI